MDKKEIYLGTTSLCKGREEVDGKFVEIENEKFYKISHYDQMDDFFMSIVSDSDHWMFISSNGALSAGRKNRNNALFPYYTDDKIHDYKDITGSKTSVLVQKDKQTYLWEPFSDSYKGVYHTVRNIYKSVYGNKVMFEEVNLDLGLGFKYMWANSERFGFVKTSTITNYGNQTVLVDVVDGIRNILPYGVDYAFQNEFSNLLDAYKKHELLSASKLGLFSLSSIPVDRAEPSESLKTTTVWCYGLPNCKVLLCDRQLKAFKEGQAVQTETDIRATRGAYLINASFPLEQAEHKSWSIVADINQDSADVVNLQELILNDEAIEKLVADDIKAGTGKLIEIVAAADGLQQSNDELGCARHFSNTLFNVMRGGIFNDNYSLDAADFRLFVSQTNQHVAGKFNDWLSALPGKLEYNALIRMAETTEDADLIRIAYEYLPLTFSRRHGDPSRPWNQFSIETKNEDGSPKLNYQGNWRDIFQNWEALGFSYPAFIEGMISKFVNASTPDGYNPYRITREGIDWECPDPHDPWAYIGYWGDHQIIYLQKLLELSDKFHPGALDGLLTAERFVYANVPYRIKPYEQIVTNPQDTITFDAELNARLAEQSKAIGADGKLLMDAQGQVYRVNFTEKILVTLLSKLSNFIPEAGIWMNTQRPEWNDANNALVGNGVSMVTLYYLRRFLKFWLELFKQSTVSEMPVSNEVKELLESVYALFSQKGEWLENGFSDAQRRYFADHLGKAGEVYREKIYKKGFAGEKATVTVEELQQFIELAIRYMDQSIEANKREDGLYHSYNLVAFSDNKVSVRYLYEMLEGQVAVLSAGVLNTEESLRVMDALKASALFREDQYSYILYPDRQLPLFIEKNTIPADKVLDSELLKTLLEEKRTSVITQDVKGACHFNGAIRNAEELKKALQALPQKQYASLLAKEQKQVLAVYESMFDHQSFTGRSGTFYGYEGLGSIYWHMVSKLLLAVQETYFDGLRQGVDASLLGRIKDHYYEIKAGIGLYKSPALYGAFPTDAYSHTPGGAGVKQPGMTGQVKEDVLSRMGELGIMIRKGQICFETSLMNPDELLTTTSELNCYSEAGEPQAVPLHAGELAFTFGKVPVIYQLHEKELISVYYVDGSSRTFEGNCLDREVSAAIFNRSGEVMKIEKTLLMTK